jgi:hypothetical protein
MANRTTNERFSRRGKVQNNEDETQETSSIMTISDFDNSALLTEADTTVAQKRR